jgi:hypothetical protein
MHRKNGKFYKAHMPEEPTTHKWWCKSMRRFRVIVHEINPPRTRFLNKLRWYNNFGYPTKIHTVLIPEEAKYTPRSDMRNRLFERLHSTKHGINN